MDANIPESEFNEIIQQFADFGDKLTHLKDCYTNEVFNSRVKSAILEQMVDEVDNHLATCEELYSKISLLLPEPSVRKPPPQSVIDERKSVNTISSPSPQQSSGHQAKRIRG